MKNNTLTFPVFPSQHEQFKEKAKKLEWALSRAKLIKKLSAFKRNDCLARALGYKSHSDLVTQSYARKQADQRQPLILFSDHATSQSIAEAFWKEFNRSQDSLFLFQSTCKQLGYKEVDWDPGIADFSDNHYKLYVMVSLNTDGINFINIDNFMIDLKWSDCQDTIAAFGLDGKKGLIRFLEKYVDMPILIEGIPPHIALKELSEPLRPIVRALYYKAADKNRDVIANPSLTNLFDEIS